jgi:hypothetical protein
MVTGRFISDYLYVDLRNNLALLKIFGQDRKI